MRTGVAQRLRRGLCSWLRLGLLATVLAMCGSTVARADAPGEQAFAIIIGNNATPAEDPGLQPLRFADDDAARYAQFFDPIVEQRYLLTVLDQKTQRRYAGLASQTRAPTVANLETAVAEISRKIRERAGTPSVVYFVFSGHGSNTKEGEPFLAMLDRGLTRSMLFTQLVERLPADRVHLIIDACNAGAVVGRGAFDREIDAKTSSVSVAEAKRVLETKALARHPHVGAIIATSAGQESHEWTRIESGVFTHELLSGAAGAADVNGDLVIEYSEIQAFVASANSQVKDPRAKPDIQAVPPSIDQRTPLVRLTDGPFLRGQARALGHFFIELENGQRYLDAHFSPASQFALRLPPDTLAFLRTPTEEAQIPATPDGTIDLDDLSFVGRPLSSRGSLDAEYRQRLFIAPYDQTYYRGFVDSRALVAVPTDGIIEHTLDRGWPWQREAAIGFWAGSGVATAVGIITAVLAADTKAQFEATTVQREAQELSSRYDTLTALSWTSFGLGAASAATGVVLWFSVSEAEDDTGAPTSTPMVHARFRF